MVATVMWVSLLAPFVLWPPVVVVIMRRMKDEPHSVPPMRSRSEAVIASFLVDGRVEECGTTVIIAIGPGAELRDGRPAVVCISNLGEPGGRHDALGVCTVAEKH